MAAAVGPIGGPIVGPIVGNDPGFDPDAARRAIGGRARGRRFRNVLYAGVGLGVLGLVGFQAWLLRGREHAAAPVDIREARAEIPDYQPASQPPATAVPEPPPPPLPARIEHDPAPRRAAMRRQEPKLPTRVAFDVQVQAQPDLGWFADGRRPRLAQGCALRPGASIIPAVLETTIQSEVPGQVIASVSEDVFDADGVGRLLIPQGTKVVGLYRDELEFQSRRMGIVWTELTMPDGTQLSLVDANGMDAAGSMGMGGEVTTRWGDLIATAALLTIFDGIQRTAIDSSNAWVNGFQEGASLNAGRLGKQVTERVLDWQPTIRIPAGTQVRISPAKTLQVC
jgi:type IV secretory pathway VirB10-like protein